MDFVLAFAAVFVDGFFSAGFSDGAASFFAAVLVVDFFVRFAADFFAGAFFVSVEVVVIAVDSDVVVAAVAVEAGAGAGVDVVVFFVVFAVVVGACAQTGSVTANRSMGATRRTLTIIPSLNCRASQR